MVFYFFCREEIVTSRAPLLAKAIAKAPEGEGCPRCGGYVYAAEQMLARGRVSLVVFLFEKIQVKLLNSSKWSKESTPRKIYVGAFTFFIIIINSHLKFLN